MLRICVTDFGGTLVSVEVKDKSGKFVDITLGYDDVAGYENDNDCLGLISEEMQTEFPMHNLP